MKRHLFFVNLITRIIPRESVLVFSPCLFRLNRADFFYLFYNISHNFRKYGKNTPSVSVIIVFMKKFILSVLLPLLFLLYSFPAVPVVADSAGEYACILTDEAYFYPTRDENRGLFLLPKTYFVKVLAIDTDFCRVEYLYDDAYAKKIVGYAKTADLTFVDYEPKRPYLYHLFEVRYTIGDSPIEDDAFLDGITVTCAYYGDYRIGTKTYCYILRGDSFGYIPKPSDLIYEESTEYQDNLTPEPPVQEPLEEEKEASSPAQIAILVALCLLVPVLAALILKSSKHPVYDPDE